MYRTKDGPGQLRLACCVEEVVDLDKFAIALVRRHQERESNPDTIRKVRQTFRILKRLGVMNVDDLAEPDLDRRFVEWTANMGWADSTKDLLRRYLHSIIRDADELGMLRSPPLLPVLPRPGGRWWRDHFPRTTRSLPPSPADVWRLLVWLQGWLQARADPWSGLRLYVLLMTIVETGIPLAAALRLTPGDIGLFWHHKIRYFPRRDGGERYAKISARLEMIFREWLKHCGSRWFFPCRSTDFPWSRYSGHTGTPQRALEAACRAARIKSFTFEQLRRFHVEHCPEGWDRWSLAYASSPGADPLTLSDFADLVPVLHRLGRKTPSPSTPEAPPALPEDDRTVVCSHALLVGAPPIREDDRAAVPGSITEALNPDLTADRSSECKGPTPVASDPRTAESPDDGSEGVSTAKDLVTTLPTDNASVVAELLRRGRTSPAALVEFMGDKESASCLEVAAIVHGDENASEQTIRMNARRTSELLAKMGVPVSYRVISGRVFKEPGSA